MSQNTNKKTTIILTAATVMLLFSIGLLVVGFIVYNFAVLLLGELLLILGSWIASALCIQLIAEKAGVQGRWRAWVPGLDYFLLRNVAGEGPGSFASLFGLGSLFLWSRVARSIQKPMWFLILVYIPLANLFVARYLARSKEVHAGDKPLNEAFNEVKKSERLEAQAEEAQQAAEKRRENGEAGDVARPAGVSKLRKENA